MLEANAQNLTLASRRGCFSNMRCFPGPTGSAGKNRTSSGCSCEDTAGRPIRTLDCGCGNAYFSYHAVRLGSRCTGITIHEWEKRRCEEMRAFLGITKDQLEFRLSDLESIAAEPDEHGEFDQVLLRT